VLTGLSIRNIVLIQALDLEFARGLSVLTGKTGAGKSILLDALGLTLGQRADLGLIRQGESQASVTATFAAPAADHPVAALLADNELMPEPGEPLMVRRTLRADGGSRAFINDQPCSVALLRDIGVHLVEVHGQHDDRGLLNPRGHRAMLDSFGRCDAAAVAGAHGRWRRAQGALDDARAAIANAARDRDYLTHALAELNDFAAEPGEEEQLATARTDMQKGARLTDDLTAVTQLLEGGEGALALLDRKSTRLNSSHRLTSRMPSSA
jgi:DNA repair protein RecN (Recombination protein N)